MKNEFQDIKVFWDIECTWLIKWAFNAPQGFLLNWKIVPSVASNNLTVAIKTLAWNDPSLTDPVYVRIWDTVRTIISALSVTKNAATNWFNAWSTELATFEIDYFVYIGYNATVWVTVWFARIPFWRQYWDFSTTTTNEKYCAISNIASAVSTDFYENVWRFSATLSAGAWYTWTVPTSTALNLIQRPIYETRLLTYLPTIVWYSANPTATFYRYKLVWNTLYVKIREGTAWTSNNVATTYTIPFSEIGVARWTAPTTIVDNWTSPTNPWLAQIATSVNVCTMYKDYNSWAWTNTWTKRIQDCNIYMEI